MSKTKRIVQKIVCLTAACSLLTAFAGCSKSAVDTSENTSNGETGSKTEKKKIAVIADDESLAYWKTVKLGAEAAAKKHGYEVSFHNIDASVDDALKTQGEKIEKELSDGVDGIVLSAVGEGLTDYLTAAYDKDVPVIALENGVHENDVKSLESLNKNPIKSSVATNNKLGAETLAKHMFDDIKNDIEKSDGYVVGIIQHNETTAAKERANAFSDKLLQLSNDDEKTKGKLTVEKEVRKSSENNSYKTALEALYEKKAKAVYMTNETVVTEIYDTIAAAADKYDDIKFYGFDAGSKQVEWMKKQSGARLVASASGDAYNVGYKAVEQAVAAAEDKTYDKTVTMGATLWNADNLESLLSKNTIYDD